MVPAMNHQFLLSFRRVVQPRSSTLCRTCHRRLLSSTPRSLAAREPTPSNKNEEFTPEPLGAPIGFQTPPKAGENTGKDARPWKQRRKELFNVDKHDEKTRGLAKSLYKKGYFQDFSNMRFHGGKSFLANPKVFKEKVALYFPNFRGTTLEGKDEKDTTHVLKGRISVVNIFSSKWASDQVNTFMGEDENSEVHQVIGKDPEIAQRVDINVEENFLKRWMVNLFEWNLRRTMSEERHGKYFIVPQGVSDVIRNQLGLLNSRVGYIYLVDRDCKIRWAASGDAVGEEKDYLIRGLQKLIADAKEPKDKTEEQSKKEEDPTLEEELEAQAVSAGPS